MHHQSSKHCTVAELIGQNCFSTRDLILISAIRKEMRSSELNEKYTVRELLQEMKTLTKVKHSGKYGHILTEVIKAQRDILNALDIQFPSMP